jgi:putative selenium metabolism protein SsnA
MIITNANLVTFWENDPLIDGALVAIEGKTIVDFGKMGKLIDRYEDTETLDVDGCVLMPGLINVHCHLWRSLAPGLPVESAKTFREMQEKFWWRFARALDPEDVYVSAVTGLLDAVKAGCTTVIDHHSSPNAVAGSLDAVGRAFAEVGMRGCLSYASSDWDGVEIAQSGNQENRRFVAKCRSEKSGMMTGLVGLDASYAVTPQTLDEAGAIAGELDSGFHVHVAEDVSDLADAKVKYQKTPVERLATAGAIRKGTLATHCLHLEDADYERVKSSGATVVHCPQSNASSSVGLGDLGRWASLGMVPAMGTDGFAPGLFEEFRAAVLQQQMRGRSVSQALEVAFKSAFYGNAEFATHLFGLPLGKIKPGARADLLVLDYTPSTPWNSANLAEHTYKGLSRAPVKAVIINGRIVYKEGIFPNLDEPRIRARARQTAKGLWERM